MASLRVGLRFLFGLVLFCDSSFAAVAKAAPAGASKLKLENVIQKFWEDSPQVAELDNQLSLAERDKTRRFIPNEPSLVYGSDQSDFSRSWGLQLNVGFPGKAFAFSELDTAMARKARRERLAKKLELAGVITQAFLDCAADQVTMQIREDTLNDLEAFATSLKARRGIVQTEKLSLEIEARQSRRDLLAAQDHRDISCRKLSSLMGSNDRALELNLPDDLDSSLLKDLGSLSPEENRAVAAMEVAQANRSLAWWSQMPDLNLSYSRKEYVGDIPSGSHQFSDIYGVSVTIPIFFPFYEQTDARRMRSQAVIDSSDALIQKKQAESDRLEAARTFRRSRQYLKELRGKDLPLGQALLESAYSAYRTGQLGFAEMIMSRKALIDLKLKEVELRTAVVTSRLKCLDQCENLNDDKKVFP